MQCPAQKLGECTYDLDVGREREALEIHAKPKVASKLRPEIRIGALGKGMQTGGSSVTHEVTKFLLP